MATEDPVVLLRENMSFVNPFRGGGGGSSSSRSGADSRRSQPQQQPPPSRRPLPHQRLTDDPDGDSWHTNAEGNASFLSASERFGARGGPASPTPTSRPRPPLPGPPLAAATAWFASWTQSSTTSPTASHDGRQGKPNAPVQSMSMNRGGSAGDASEGIDGRGGGPRSPAKSMTMNRGADTPQTEGRATNGVAMPSSLPSLPLGDGPDEGQIAASGPLKSNGSSRSPLPVAENSSAHNGPKGDVDNDGDDGSEGIDKVHEMDLPPYPDPKAPRTTARQPTGPPDKSLLEDFPKPAAAAAVNTNANVRSASASNVTASVRPASASNASAVAAPPPDRRRRLPPLAPRGDETTFPGFALVQIAESRRRMGKTDEALGAVAECLAFQRASFGGGGAGLASGGAAAGAGTGTGANAAGSAADKAGKKAGGQADAKSGGAAAPHAVPAGAMTPLDLRASFVAAAGTGVLGAVRSLQDSHRRVVQRAGDGTASNSVAIAASHYPSVPCVARALLLRGRLLYDRGMACGEAAPFVEAARHAEMAAFILRKVGVSHEELAAPLAVLGEARTRLGHLEEADVALGEAVAVLGDARSGAERDRRDAAGAGDAEAESDCAGRLDRIAREYAAALFLRGKSYHRRRSHVQAFDCYNQALVVVGKLKKGNGHLRKELAVKRIVRCMKHRCALEKLVSDYWDDSTI
ncbi:hypothetical protein ACHAWF_006178 [Thalassiosira exigua]